MHKHITIFCLLLSAFSCSSTEKGSLETAAQAVLTSASQKDMLTNVKLQETSNGIKIHVQATGLRPGSVHGLHIHEYGKCEGNFKSAGGHYNPEKSPHGGPASRTKHLGDLGNLVADKVGEATTEVFIGNNNHNFDQLIGKSVILHSKADDLVSQPA